MARMTRRLPPALRMWSGALLVCALVVCLGGLARPAMAMTMAMPGAMEMAPAAMATGHMSGHDAELAVEQAVAESPTSTPHCPMAEEQCIAPKAVLSQDVPVGPGLTGSPQAVAGCSPDAVVAQPNAPPRALSPPDLHRLCVSRT